MQLTLDEAATKFHDDFWGIIVDQFESNGLNVGRFVDEDIVMSDWLDANKVELID